MSISQKLKIMAISAVLGLVAIGFIGIGVASSLESALKSINESTVPGIETIYELKSYSQSIPISILKHNMTDQMEQMLTLEKEVADAQKGMQSCFDKYEKMVRTPKGKELLQAERATAEDYFSKLPAILEKSRNNDKAGAFALSPAMGVSRAKLAKLIDDHIALNNQWANETAAQANSTASQGYFISIAIILIAIIGISTLSFFVIRGINRSVSSMQQAVTRIEGNLDFTVRADVIGKDEIAQVSIALNRLLDKLRGSLVAISQNAHKVAESSAQMASAAEQVAIASTHQSDSASSMAASVEEMTVSINHVSDRSAEAQSLSKESGKLAESGTEVISQTVSDINAIAASVHHVSTRIQELESHSTQISSIVSVIKDVAEQTNLLALNAAIEAARAGEQGRGFAVVADEVRKLAERTAASTKEIASMIDAIKTVSREAVDSMGNAVELVATGVERASNASGAIQQIGSGSHKVVSMVEEITIAIREQSEASNNIAGNVEKIAQMAEESSAAAQSSAVSARELDHLAKDMREIIEHYKL